MKLTNKMMSLKDKIIGKFEVKTDDKPAEKVEQTKTRKDNKTMKKTIMTAFLLLALPALVFAGFNPATLTN
jgi:hypothetical protein